MAKHSWLSQHRRLHFSDFQSVYFLFTFDCTSARIPQSGVLSKIPQPGVLSQEFPARNPQPGFLSQESSAKIPQPGFLSQESPANLFRVRAGVILLIIIIFLDSEFPRFPGSHISDADAVAGGAARRTLRSQPDPSPNAPRD